MSKFAVGASFETVVTVFDEVAYAFLLSMTFKDTVNVPTVV